MKKLLITGANGFIGSHVVPLAVKSGFETHCVSRKPPATSEAGTRWHRADCLNNAQVAAVLEEIRPTHLLHLAWTTEHGVYWHSPENFRWLEAGLSLLRKFRETGGVRAVIAGTCAEYDWDCGFLSEGATPLRPSTPYGVCKKCLQEAFTSYCAETGLSGAWGRLFFLYGPGEGAKRLFPSIVEQARASEEIKVTHGEQIRDFLHVGDAAEAFIALLKSGVGGPVNIASGVPVTIRQFVVEVAGQLGALGKVRFGAIPTPENTPPMIVADVRRLAGEVGWTPRTTLADGIAETLKGSRRPT